MTNETSADKPMAEARPALAGMAAPVEVEPKATVKAPAKAGTVSATRKSAKPVSVAPPAATSAATPVAKAAKPKNRVVRPAPPKAAASQKPAIRKAITMTTTDFTTKIQDAMKDASERAKAMFEKSQTSFSDVPEFAKGNVEAIIESSKILAAGLQDMGKSYVEESKTAFETISADVKDLAAVKSPTEFFEKQSALARKNFDAAVAATSKSSEAVLKLANEAFQPLSTRMSLAIEKIKKAA